MPAITDLLNRYLGKEQPKPPPISTGTAAALLVVYTIFYVAPFYLSPTTRPSRTLSRDAPSVIRARITSVSLTCVVCSGITWLILTSNGSNAGAGLRDGGSVLHSMGYWPLGLAETVRSLLLTATLFAGPLYEAVVVNGGWRQFSLQPIAAVFSEWIPWRNIIVGPFTEEVLFRSASVPLMLLAGTSVTRTIFLSPLIFGLAHVHHFYEFRLTQPHVPAIAGLLRSVLQFSYTSLFGAYATFLFLRTGSLLAIFVVHAFCNIMGLPRFWGRVEPDDNDDEADDDRNRGKVLQGRKSIMWSVVYYALLVAGVVGWWRNLGTLTASDNALVTIKI